MTPAPFAVLLVAATEPELAGIRHRLEARDAAAGATAGPSDVRFEYLVTGVGPVATAASLTERLVRRPVDMVVNVGLAGAFSRDVPLGSVTCVTTETFGDLGAEDSDGRHLSLFELGLHDADAPPFRAGYLFSSFEDAFDLGAQPVDPRLLRFVYKAYELAPPTFGFASGTTVSLTHGSPGRIADFSRTNAADVESMEGAAVFYCCGRQDTHRFQFRAISNYVESRNRAAWEIGKALTALTAHVTTLLIAFEREVRDAAA